MTTSTASVAAGAGPGAATFPPVAGGATVRQRAGRAAVVVLVLGLAVAWLVAGRAAVPSDGSLVLPSVSGWRNGLEVSAAVAHSSLREGDRVLAIDGVPPARWVVEGTRPSRGQGDPVSFTVLRDGQRVTVSARLTPYPLAATARQDAPLLVVLGIMAVVGALIFLARPDDPAARVMMVVGGLLVMTATSYPAGMQVIDLARRHGDWGYLGGDVAAALFWGAVLHFSVVFPQPVLSVRTRRWMTPTLYLVPFALYAGDLAVRLPLTHAPLLRYALLHGVSSPAARVVPVLAVARVGVTYLRSKDPDVRRRIAWVVVAFLVGFGAYLGLGQLPELVTGSPLVPWQWLVLVLAPIPATIAAAVLRYRLFDIEVILTRSLLYGSLTVVAVGVYAACYLVLRQLPESGTPAVAFVAGVVTAVCLQPLRSRLSVAANRLVYGERDDPYEVLARLDRLPSGAALQEVLQAVAETLASTLRLPHVGIAVDGGFSAMAGTPSTVPEDAVQVPIRQGDRVLGALSLGVGPRRERFGPADRRLLETVSRRVGEAAHAGLLHADLQWSRQRIVMAREEERRRLRRDLHDGIGPALAGLGMQLEVIRDDVLARPEAAHDRISRVVVATHELVGEIRRVVDGLRPAALDQLGLPGALSERLRWLAADDRDVLLVVDVDTPLGQLPAAVEVAAFHIANEATTNAVRHSGARRCTVTLRRDHELTIEVADDGHGVGADVRHGVGLLSMRERAEELGGSLTVSARPSGGTVVLARLPVPFRRAQEQP
jgi:signal transduction histidine kinase